MNKILLNDKQLHKGCRTQVLKLFEIHPLFSCKQNLLHSFSCKQNLHSPLATQTKNKLKPYYHILHFCSELKLKTKKKTGFFKKSLQAILVMKLILICLWLLLLYKKILFFLVSLLFHPGVVEVFQVSFTKKSCLL